MNLCDDLNAMLHSCEELKPRESFSLGLLKNIYLSFLHRKNMNAL